MVSKRTIYVSFFLMGIISFLLGFGDFSSLNDMLPILIPLIGIFFIGMYLSFKL